MAIKKIYTNQELQELQVQWSEKGIHLTITQEDYPETEFILEADDIVSVMEDLECFYTAIKETK